MRKPLVAVCVTASAVMLAGAVVATAGADTTPDQPVVPGAAPAGVPALPQEPAGGDGPAFDLPGLVAQAQDQTGRPQGPAAPDEPAQQPPAAQLPAAEHPAVQRPADQGTAAAQQSGAQRPAAGQRPDAGQGPAAQGTAAAQQPGAQRPATGQRPAAERPAAQRPAVQRPVRQPAGSAHQTVTRDSVSGSVDAPVQRQMLALVDENRRRAGCGGLTLDRRLIAAANRHAADMAGRGYFAHSSPDGDGAGERVEDAGYRWSRYGENIARGQTSVAEVVDGWMHSPEHRANILDCRLHQMGVGLAFDGDDQPYWVQDFATPKG